MHLFFLLLYLSVAVLTSFNYQKFNVTGTYKTKFNNAKGETFPQGIIKVKKLNNNRIVIFLIMQNGKPLLRSGSFVDTLKLLNNRAEYKNAEIDTTCKILLSFSYKGILVKQSSKSNHSSCDFAEGVRADGFYYKVSAQTPNFKTPY